MSPSSRSVTGTAEKRIGASKLDVIVTDTRVRNGASVIVDRSQVADAIRPWFSGEPAAVTDGIGELQSALDQAPAGELDRSSTLGPCCYLGIRIEVAPKRSPLRGRTAGWWSFLRSVVTS
jgi:hypothetical protein